MSDVPIALPEGMPTREGIPVRYDLPGASLIVVRVNGTVRAYLNRCPHRGTELDWMPGRFFDHAGEHLQCATHGALFRMDTGECVAGACRGQSLTAIRVTARETGTDP